MRSIAYAMTWETLARGRWAILTSSLAAVAFPAVLVMALRRDGVINWQDPVWINLHVAMATTAAFICALALRTAQGPITGLFSMPVTTSQIVIWRFLPASVIIALQYAVSTVIINAMFGMDWPILGPALVAAVALPAINAVVWLTEKSMGWLSFGVAVVGALIGLWFKSRYGHPFSPPQYYWPAVTRDDFLVCFCTAIFAYVVGVFAVARNRRGEPQINLGIADWVERQFQNRERAKAFKSAFQAQGWCEWQRSGWGMPVGLFFLIFIGLVVWLIFDRTSNAIGAGLVIGNLAVLVLATICGVLSGNVNAKDTSYAMGHFLATRPVSDSELARVIMVGVAKSLFLTWIIWSVCSAVGYCFVSSIGISPKGEDMPIALSVRYYFYVMLGSWVAASTLAYLGLFGRSKAVFQTLCVLLGVLISGVIFCSTVLSPNVAQVIGQVAFVLVAIGILVGTAFLFFDAARRSLILTRTAWATAGIWLMGVVAGATPELSYGYPQLLLLAAFLALAVSPIAAAPLAISLNRHR